MSLALPVDPLVHLSPAQPVRQTAEGGYVSVTSVTDLFSVSAWVNEAVKELTGFDILTSIVQPLSGDWERISRYGDALKKTAACLRGIADNVATTNTTLDYRWNGNAADAAHTYFASTHRSLTAHADVLDRAATQYQQLAVDAWTLCEAAKGMVQSIIDKALLAMIYTAAGTALCETGIGAVAGYALATMEVASLMQDINRASMRIQTGNMLLQTGFSLMAGISKELQDLGPIPTIGAAYDHPLAR
ncbi:hypothetical protein Cs7R123_63740 [Catellatospora sp. TT07R-123]|uniref:hypothetical protein n=1 Tax=Catellatospora sp. TT07R-123 TaxID=2733863 RepID=UPI001B1BCDB0|nr:hypothetical protein [Catellatospora sp. TT07R-123]GHJ49032.1 hypothetical protein Cs7R123_63740 [Catellatospora sp. TT07R-123]